MRYRLSVVTKIENNTTIHTVTCPDVPGWHAKLWGMVNIQQQVGPSFVNWLQRRYVEEGRLIPLPTCGDMYTSLPIPNGIAIKILLLREMAKRSISPLGLQFELEWPIHKVYNLLDLTQSAVGLKLKHAFEALEIDMGFIQYTPEGEVVLN